MPDPRTGAFWRAEEQKMWELMIDLAMRAMIGGATNGLELLPAGIQSLFDWDVFNQAAIDFLRTYRLETVANINETSRASIIDMMDDWIREGAPLPELEKRLAALPTLSDNRARQIAVTEITRLYASGNQTAWMTTGVVSGKRWRTAQDEKVCPYCGPLHNQIVSIEGSFEIPDDALTPELRRNALGRGFGETRGLVYASPPAHVNCRCWLQPIVREEDVRASIRAA